MPDTADGTYQDSQGNISPLLDAIIEQIPHPEGDEDGTFQMQISSLENDPHYGRYVIGKVVRGKASMGMSIVAVNADDPEYKVSGKIKGIFSKDGLQYMQLDQASVGQIIAIAGLDDVAIGDTVCSLDGIEALPVIQISPPSLKIKFEANTSPFLGKEGKFPNWKQIQSRLDREAENNVGLKIVNNRDGSYSVSGRGELHLAILIETMRREGYEFQISKPEVVTAVVDGVLMEPVEEVYIEVPEEYYSAVSQDLNERKGELISIENENGLSKLTYKVFTRNLMGLRRVLLTSTKGEAVINSKFMEYAKFDKPMITQTNGRIVSSAQGKALAYSLNTIQDRGELIIEQNTEVYEGMIIGINKYENDMPVNATKAREKNNVSMSHAEVTLVNLKTPIVLTLEYALGMIRDDEYLEITPLNIRLRKKFLNKQQEYEATKKRHKAKEIKEQS